MAKVELQYGSMPTPDTNTLQAALIGYQQQYDAINARVAELRRALGMKSPARAAGPTAIPEPKRKISAAGRARIAAAQRKRWAESKRQSSPSSKPKRKLSAAGRKAIAEATRKRWAAFRAAKQAPKPVATKKAAKKAAVKAAPARAAKKAPAKKASVKLASPPAPAPEAAGE